MGKIWRGFGDDLDGFTSITPLLNQKPIERRDWGTLAQLSALGQGIVPDLVPAPTPPGILVLDHHRPCQKRLKFVPRTQSAELGRRFFEGFDRIGLVLAWSAPAFIGRGSASSSVPWINAAATKATMSPSTGSSRCSNTGGGPSARPRDDHRRAW
ncbi:hypothetical protein [Actinoplanes sp. NPDC026623]|uniref:hypothetical protein n=1 Tax=Actinoplanes sp. NPDC026623 TaxID=3155610 RepID=UPI0033E6342C